MPNRTEARPAKAVLTNATGRLPLLRLFSTPLVTESLRVKSLDLVNKDSMQGAVILQTRDGRSGETVAVLYIGAPRLVLDTLSCLGSGGYPRILFFLPSHLYDLGLLL